MTQQFFEAIRAGDRDKVDSLLNSDATLLAAKDEKGLGAYTVRKVFRPQRYSDIAAREGRRAGHLRGFAWRAQRIG